MKTATSPPSDDLTPKKLTDQVWAIAARLYGVTVGAVLVSAMVVFFSTRLTQAPLPPSVVSAALESLNPLLPSDASLGEAVRRVAKDVDHAVGIYDSDGALVVSSDAAPPPLPTDVDMEALLRRGPPRVGRAPHDRGPKPPDAFEPRPPSVRPPHHDWGPERGPHGPDRGPEQRRHKSFFGPMLETGPLFIPLVDSQGHRYVAAAQRPSRVWLVPATAVVVMALLAVLAVVVALTLTRPLRELADAADAFGRGDFDRRVDLDKAGAFSALAVAFNDMVGRVFAARRAERELLANVSHELRTPLSRIRVALELASDGEGDIARESLDDIGTDLAELEKLIQDIFTAARLEGTGMTLAPMLRLAEHAVTPIVDDAAARFRRAWPKHHLEIDADDDLPPAVIDPSLLRRALDNLLDNAGKYSEPDTAVYVMVRVDDDDVVIAIGDAGTGMSPEDQAALFTPFFRADRSRSRQKGGVGLGLLLVKRIAEAHGGAVRVESARGRGTTVTMRVPRNGPHA